MKKDNIEWEPRAWLTDPGVRILSLSSRGFWVDILNRMALEGGTGKLSATITQLSRAVGCTDQETHSCLNEIATSRTADVTDCDGIVTIINRRMQREHTKRGMARARTSKYRGAEGQPQDGFFAAQEQCDANVTQDFDQFWGEYPRKVNKQTAEEAYRGAAKVPGFPGIDELLTAVRQQKRSIMWTKDGGQFIPYPSTWLNQKRWEDVCDGSVLGGQPYRSTGGNL